MVAVGIDSCEALSRTNVRYVTELRLERLDGEPVWIIDTRVKDPAKEWRMTPYTFTDRGSAFKEFAKHKSMLAAIDGQRLNIQADGQARLL